MLLHFLDNKHCCRPASLCQPNKCKGFSDGTLALVPVCNLQFHFNKKLPTMLIQILVLSRLTWCLIFLLWTVMWGHFFPKHPRCWQTLIQCLYETFFFFKDKWDSKPLNLLLKCLMRSLLPQYQNRPLSFISVTPIVSLRNCDWGRKLSRLLAGCY